MNGVLSGCEASGVGADWNKRLSEAQKTEYLPNGELVDLLSGFRDISSPIRPTSSQSSVPSLVFPEAEDTPPASVPLTGATTLVVSVHFLARYIV